MHIRSRFKRQHVVKIFQISSFLKESPPQTDQSTKKKSYPGQNKNISHKEKRGKACKAETRVE